MLIYVVLSVSSKRLSILRGSTILSSPCKTYSVESAKSLTVVIYATDQNSKSFYIVENEY